MKTIINLVDKRYGNLATTITSGNPTDLIGYYLEVLDTRFQSLVIKVEGVASMVSKWEIANGGILGFDEGDYTLWSVTEDDLWLYEPRNRRELVEMMNKTFTEQVKIAEEWRGWL